MSFLERLDNIYAVDGKMFGHDKYMSLFLIAGKELALVDTGMPVSYEAVRAGIKAHGFSLRDISHIFITHCEHWDHSGNAGALLKEAPKANVYINPMGETFLTDPSIEVHRRLGREQVKDAHSWGEMVPVPASRIRHLKDGDRFDLGDGEVLQVIFTPGHQPSGIVLYEHKNKGLFINDLVGNYFADADAHAVLTSVKADIRQGMVYLQKLMTLPVEYLYLGHYGIINEKNVRLMERTVEKTRQLLEIGLACARRNDFDSIGDKLREFLTPYLENVRKVRGEALYQYASQRHIPFLIRGFTEYCQERL